uniref:Protein phosphatase 1, regulatory (inhibitor) subunit 14Bb n=1 Tax=Amphiprion ocellaris TaxID=80972 RepID=A0AAQ6AAU7_AMPOC
GFLQTVHQRRLHLDECISFVCTPTLKINGFLVHKNCPHVCVSLSLSCTTCGLVGEHRPLVSRASSVAAPRHTDRKACWSICRRPQNINAGSENRKDNEDLFPCVYEKSFTDEEAIPELEIDVDELLDMPSDVERAARVKDLLVDCFKPTEDFISELLDKIRGMQKLSTPQKK